MSPEELGAVLVALGCPQERSVEMASQLDKRARQLSGDGRQTYEAALIHLIGLMKQGWAAKERGF